MDGNVVPCVLSSFHGDRVAKTSTNFGAIIIFSITIWEETLGNESWTVPRLSALITFQSYLYVYVEDVLT